MTAGSALKIGDRGPDVTVLVDGRPTTLTAYRDGRILVLSFLRHLR